MTYTGGYLYYIEIYGSLFEMQYQAKSSIYKKKKTLSPRVCP